MMEVTELSLKNGNKQNNRPLLPSNLRELVIGNSNCGKSVLLFNLLLKKDHLDYNNLLLFGNSLHQPRDRGQGRKRPLQSFMRTAILFPIQKPLIQNLRIY